jgi:acetyltransferase-like isoleucine patch superfamily enzyme
VENVNALFNKLKRIYWEIIPEVREWYRAILFDIPGKIGQYTRKNYAVTHFAACGKKPLIDPHVRIFNPQNLKVGNDVIIGGYTHISAGGGVTIGNGVLIGPFVKIWSINHNYKDPDIPIEQQGWTISPVIIEDNVWIGTGSVVLPGSSIGKGAIVSAGSVLRRMNIHPFSIVAGNPAKLVGNRKDKSSRL